MERYDIAIIGTGPAGLEAAITAKIRNKKIILFGNKNLSLKVEKAHTIQNYLGLPDIGGEELKAAYEAHLKARWASILPCREMEQTMRHRQSFLQPESALQRHIRVRSSF